MANHASALKRQRQNQKRRLRNASVRSKLRTVIKKVEKTTKKAEGLVVLREAVSQLAKAAKKGILKKNTAARRVSRLSKLVNKLA
jgi:small subunit ribosomal protein S20